MEKGGGEVGKPLISIIIPVYQAEKYLRECVESVLAQTQKGLEIVLVDDGSTDASGEICEDFCRKEENVRVIHKKNAGLTAAWKTGVRASEGIYLGFVDSDDWIEDGMYERLYHRAVETGADIVCCGIMHVFEDHIRQPWEDEMLFPEGVYTEEEIRKQMYPRLINNGTFMGRGLQPNRVSKLLRRELVLRNMDCCHDGVTVGEDFQFSLAMFLEAEKVAVIKGYFPYYYRVNRDSMTGAYEEDYLDKIKLMREQMNRIGREKDKYDFGGQIENDFLCLSVLHLKEGVLAGKREGYGFCRKRMKGVCLDPAVRGALMTYKMPGLTLAERVFLLLMKCRGYYLIYLAVRFYFMKINILLNYKFR